MGGFGAVRYAQDRPDLFAYVASFSGAVDLGDPGTRSVITEQAVQNGYPYSPLRARRTGRSTAPGTR